MDSPVASAALIFSIMVWVMGFALHGQLPWTMAAFVLLALVMLAGIGRAIRSTLVGTMLRLGLPAASLLVYAGIYGHGEFLSVVLWSVVLFMPLFGLYIMVGELRRR